MVPMDLNIGFQGLALIQGQIYNREKLNLLEFLHFCWAPKVGGQLGDRKMNHSYGLKDDIMAI